MLTWWSWITLLNYFRTHRWMLVKSRNISAIRAFITFRGSSSNAMVSAQPDILRKIEKESCSEQFNSTARNWLLLFVDKFRLFTFCLWDPGLQKFKKLTKELLEVTSWCTCNSSLIYVYGVWRPIWSKQQYSRQEVVSVTGLSQFLELLFYLPV